jgi:hypothetical protein
MPMQPPPEAYGPNFTPYVEPTKRNRGNPTFIARAGRRTVNERHPSFEVPVSRALEKHRQCEVDQCFRKAEDFGHLCARHRLWERDHGHPTAGHLPRQYLGYWIVYAQRYIKQLDKLSAGHPAKDRLTLARHWWNTEVARAHGYAATNWRPHQSHRTRWYRHIDNITLAGFTTDKVLSLVAAFFCVRYKLQSDNHELFQLARLVLQSATLPYPPWHSCAGKTELIGKRFALWAGNRLLKALGTFCGGVAQVIQGEPFGGFPPLEASRPVTPSVAARAAARRRAPKRPDYDDD